jgi:hypothetical protein
VAGQFARFVRFKNAKYSNKTSLLESALSEGLRIIDDKLAEVGGIHLKDETLGLIERGGRGVLVPTYQRENVTAGVVHFGISHFFRSHQVTKKYFKKID